MEYKRYSTLGIRALLLGALSFTVVACSSGEHPAEAYTATKTNTAPKISASVPDKTGNPIASQGAETVLANEEKTSSGSLEKSDLDIKRITRTVAYSLPVFHLNQLQMNTEISTNACNMFIESLDPAHCYFLQSDIDAFSKEAPDLYKHLRKGDISFARNVYKVLMKRIANRTAFAEEQLQEGFDTDKDETFLWDRKDAPWPKDNAEWDDLWRKRLKNEYIARLVSKQLYEEETNAVSRIAATNATAATETTNATVTSATESTNATVSASSSSEDAIEDPDLTPEEFILERYKQFKLTMESFDEEMLLQRYLTAFAQVYDPHSDYMSPSSLEDFDINMKLSLVGIGAMLRPEDGTAKIVRVIPGGPADQDGRLQEGDKIIAVGQGDKESVSILHWPLYKAVRLIRGEKDTKVVLTIIPASDRSGTRTKKIELIRDEVKLEEQAAKGEVKTVECDDGKTRDIGVITLPDFYADFSAKQNDENARRASSDVRKLLQQQVSQGIDGLVLDLRNNGGGSLVEAIEITGLFIKSGPVVQVKQSQGIHVLPDADPEVDYDGPMIVLVNRLSASASEILAAALQDYKRAIIVGDEKTHGKGTVQELMPLQGGRTGSLKLTTQRFYRINGGSTQMKGVTPDIVIPDYLDVMELGEESLDHALPWDHERAAMYRAQKGLDELLPLLSEQSKERLDNNSEFQAYMTRRERLKERYETKTVSLSLSNRLAEAEAEKELDEIQDAAFIDSSGEKKGSKDIVLNEAFNILSDLIDLQQIGKDNNVLLAPNLSSVEE